MVAWQNSFLDKTEKKITFNFLSTSWSKRKHVVLGLQRKTIFGSFQQLPPPPLVPSGELPPLLCYTLPPVPCLQQKSALNHWKLQSVFLAYHYYVHVTFGKLQIKFHSKSYEQEKVLLLTLFAGVNYGLVLSANE